MKKRMKQIIAVVVLLTMGLNASIAQTLVGYIDAEGVIQTMPDYKKGLVDVETVERQLQKDLATLDGEIKTYYTEVLKKQQAGELSGLQLQEADAKLKNMQADLEKKTLAARQELAKKQGEILKPVYDRFNAALKKVAKANKCHYVADTKIFVYKGGGIDLTRLVMDDLGL